MAEPQAPSIAPDIKFTPSQLNVWLSCQIEAKNLTSVMIWGPPGVGKSTVVKAVADEHGLSFIDVRLSQLAPTDLRGLPVPDHTTKTAKWYPPEFLPQQGRGILFFDEINMAPPVMQGIAQQIVLDRRVGSYTVPDGWLIWAAGNRKEDLASVFDFSAPLANRFLHVSVKPDLPSFLAYGYSVNPANRKVSFSPLILTFLQQHRDFLHKIDPKNPAWPSPRSWDMANKLARGLRAVGLPSTSLDIAPAVGATASSQYHDYIENLGKLPSLDNVAGGRNEPFPDDASLRYILVGALVEMFQADANADPNFTRTMNALSWVSNNVKGNTAEETARILMINTFLALRHKADLFAAALNKAPGLNNLKNLYLSAQQAAGG